MLLNAFSRGYGFDYKWFSNDPLYQLTKLSIFFVFITTDLKYLNPKDKTMKISSKTGPLIAARIVGEEEEELITVSKKGQVIRLDLKEIPSLGRQTQGVRIMKLRAGDSIASLIVL